jgi:hypothetical protein
LYWLFVFGKAFSDVFSDTGTPRLALTPFKCLVFLGIVVAIAFIAAAIHLDPRLDDIQHLQKDSLGAGARS